MLVAIETASVLARRVSNCYSLAESGMLSSNNNQRLISRMCHWFRFLEITKLFTLHQLL